MKQKNRLLKDQAHLLFVPTEDPSLWDRVFEVPHPNMADKAQRLSSSKTALSFPVLET